MFLSLYPQVIRRQVTTFEAIFECRIFMLIINDELMSRLRMFFKVQI